MKKVDTTKFCTKEQLSKDIRHIHVLAVKKGYYLTSNDVFALGYLAGKYNLKNLLTDTTELEKACDKYDKTDDLGLLDTIKEILMDLKVLKGVIKN